MLNLVRGGLQAELDHFFHSAMGHENPRHVSKSAFCQARKKLKPEALRSLLHHLAVQTKQQLPVPRWHGLRVLAADGSTLRMPDHGDLRDAFGGMTPTCGPFRVLARTVSIFDVATQTTIDAELASYQTGERALLVNMLDRITSDNLLLLDRGFPSFALLYAFEQRHIPFCMRLDPRHWNQAKQFMRSGDSDRTLEFTPSCAIAKTLRKHGITPHTVTLRLVKHPLPNGRELVLLTSVLDTAITPAQFGQLYQWRWRIEEGFKHIKSRAEIENWTGMSSLSVKQDFYCKLINANVAALLAYSSQVAPENLDTLKATHSNGWRIRPNLTYLLSQLKHRLPQMLLGLRPIRKILTMLLDLIVKTRERTQPNRRNLRKMGVKLQGHHRAYKRCA